MGTSPSGKQIAHLVLITLRVVVAKGRSALIGILLNARFPFGISAKLAKNCSYVHERSSQWQ
eukprot:9836625-Karenia_brevis.AAC.1